MKDNSTPEPDPANPQVEAVAKADGLYFIAWPDHPTIKALEAKVGIAAVSFVWVQFGRIYACEIKQQITPDRIPHGVTFKGPFLP